jgi:SSS family transporter
MKHLSAVDLAIVALYIAGMTLLGAWFSRRQKDLRTYFVGGRDIGWPLVLLSIVATETSAVTFLSVPGLAYNPKGGNLQFLQLSFGYILGRCVVAWFLLPQYMRGDLFSAYEILRRRFSPAVQRAASGLFLATRTIADGLRLFLTALLLQYAGWGIEASILAVGVVTIIYTFLGGMKAVIWTDLVQFLIKIAGAALAGVFALILLPGGIGEYLRIGSEAGKFTLFDFTFDPTKPYNLWAGVIGGAVFSMASHGADQLMVQRYLCARSLKEARLALVLSGVVIFFQFLLFLLVGVALFALQQAGTFELPPGVRNDEVFGRFIIEKLPQGVVGVLIAAVLAAAMSTLSSSLNSSANAFVTDFYRPLRPHRSERFYVWLSRIMTVVWGLAQMGVAIAAFQLGGQKSVVEQVLTVAGFTTGLLLGLFVLGSLRRSVGSEAALAGMACGFATVLAVWLPSVFGEPILAWPWLAPLGAVTTVLAALLLDSLMPTRPPSGAPG